MIAICTCCLQEKNENDFYKNAKKLNGLDSQCKACILARKSNKYKKVIAVKKKNTSMRNEKKTTVLDVESCTFKTMRLTTILPEQRRLLTEELVVGILCHLKK